MSTASNWRNNLFAKYGHECEIGNTRDELPMFKSGGNVCTQIRNQLRRATMASDDNRRAIKFFKSQRNIDLERLNHLLHKHMLHPFSDIRRWWETMMVFIFFLIFIVIPLDLASYNFPIKHNLNNVVLWKVLRLFLDLICCLDVIINFCTGYIDSKSHRIVMEPKKIAMRYGFTFFIPDLISSLPTHLDLFSKSGNNEVMFSILQNIAILKAFRFVTFIRYCRHAREVYNFNYVKSRVILTMFCYILYFHILACVGLVVIGRTTKEKKKIQLSFKKEIFVWIVDTHEFDFFGAYFRVLRAGTYLATFSFTSVLFVNHMPKPFMILIWIMSKILNFFLISQLMELVISTRSSSRKYLEMVRELKEYMGHKQLPISLQNRLLNYYNFKFQTSYFRESEILSVITGQLKQVRHLEDGEYFGEYSLLKRAGLRESSVVAVENCELYRLDYEDFTKVIMSYPDLIDKITKHAVERIEMTEYVEERSKKKPPAAK